MAQVAAVLGDRKKSVRLTQNDSMVLARLREKSGPMKAYDLLETLRADGINAPMTVYRALSRLTSHGLVKKIESMNAFYAVSEEETGRMGAFLVCAECDAIGFQLLSEEQVAALGSGLSVRSASIEMTTGCFSSIAAPLSRRCPKAD